MKLNCFPPNQHGLPKQLHKVYIFIFPMSTNSTGSLDY